MAGTTLSNSMSTTGPMTCTTLPTFSVGMLSIPYHPRRRGSAAPHECYVLRSGSRYDLDDLLRDRGLAHLVHVQGQAIDHLAGVAGGRVHGRHARAVLRGRRFQQRPPDLDLDVFGEDLVVDLPRPRLVQVVERGLVRLDGLALDGEEPLHDDALLDDALELVVDEVDLIHLARGEGLDEVAGDGLGGGVAQGLEQAHLLGADAIMAAAEEVAALAAEQLQ